MSVPAGLASAITQRPAVADDATAVATVWTQSRRQLMPFVPAVHGDDEVRQWLQTVLLPSGGVTVAVVDQQLVAMLAVSRADGISWIDQLYVHPAQVGRGLGAALLGQALVNLPRPVQLYCFQDNGRARRFYERRGFCAVSLSDGAGNEERCPDVLYRLDTKLPAQAPAA